MPAGNTYEAIATQTLGSTATSVTFSSIPATYTDLVLVITGNDSRTGANDDSVALNFNTDTSTGSTNYSFTTLTGNGSSASSSRTSNANGFDALALGTATNTNPGTIVIHIMNYSNTTTYKTALTRGGNASSLTAATVGLWRNTAAINLVKLLPGYNGSPHSFQTGTTFNLYGIKAA